LLIANFFWRLESFSTEILKFCLGGCFGESIRRIPSPAPSPQRAAKKIVSKPAHQKKQTRTEQEFRD